MMFQNKFIDGNFGNELAIIVILLSPHQIQLEENEH
jgi:hypothetical protein